MNGFVDACPSPSILIEFYASCTGYGRNGGRNLLTAIRICVTQKWFTAVKCRVSFLVSTIVFVTTQMANFIETSPGAKGCDELKQFLIDNSQKLKFTQSNEMDDVNDKLSKGE